VALRISAGRYTPCLYEMVIKMRKIEDSLLVQIYAQKFLTYIVCLISSYVIFLEIFFNLDKLVKLDLIIRVIFTILIFTLFVSIVSFAILSYRTHVELFVSEMESGTIKIIDLVHQRLVKVPILYRAIDFLLIPEKKKSYPSFSFCNFCFNFHSSYANYIANKNLI